MAKRKEVGTTQTTSLGTRLVFMVAVPLLLQVLFTGFIWTLKIAADRHAYDMGIARELTGAVRVIVASTFTITGYVNQALDKGLTLDYFCNKEVGLIQSWSKWLSSNQGTEAMGAKAQEVSERDEPMVAKVHVACMTNQISLRQTKQLKYTPAEVRPKISNTEAEMEQALNELQNLQKQYMAQSQIHPVSELQEKLYACTVAGIAANLVMLVILGVAFSRGIVDRLSIVSDNVERIQRKSKLLPEVAGNDEIASLDASFRDMAMTMREEEERERALCEHAYNVLCAIDSGRRFLEVNQASTTVLGYSPRELIGKPVEDFVPPRIRSQCVTRLERVVGAEPHTEFELTMVKRDGSLLETLWTTSSTAEHEKVFCVLHDISKRKAAQKLRKEMVQMVSQELRAPLMVLSGVHSALKTQQLGQLNEKGHRLLAAADANTTRMLRLIDDLLDIEKLESGLVELQQVKTDLVPLFNQAMDSVLMLAGQKQINLTNASEGDYEIAYVDPNRIIQILVNLLSNAIKFSPPGSTIVLSLHRSGRFAEIHVTDQGRGIPAQLVKGVFNRFQQVQRGDATEKGGSGLGLAICKSLVELHGGNISVESVPGKGSNFIIRLPLS